MWWHTCQHGIIELRLETLFIFTQVRDYDDKDNDDDDDDDDDKKIKEQCSRDRISNSYLQWEQRRVVHWLKCNK